MSLQKKFEQFLVNQAFNEIEPYRDSKVWESLNPKERELLGLLFIKEGEDLLKRGDSRVLENFKLASEVASHSPIVFFNQGIVYASQEQNIRCLTAARHALEKAIEIAPDFFKAWHVLSNVLVRIGLFYEDASLFLEADRKFSEVEKLASQRGEAHTDTFYWDWGVCWYHIGKNSGEAVDFYQALEKFRQAAEEGLDDGHFYNNYGNVLIEIAFLMGRKELFYDAIHFYRKCISLIPEHWEGWLNLGCTYQRLYELLGNDEYLRLTEESFEKVAEYKPMNFTLWLKWGELCVYAAKLNRDVDRFSLSLDKFERAAACDPDHPLLLIKWGEAQMHLGANLEDLGYLRDAEAKIARSLEASPEEAEYWYIYGMCYSEYGRYFSDEVYYHQAIEKFQYGLNLNNNFLLLWYGMALAHFAIGELRGDAQMIEKSAQFCGRALEHGGQAFGQFWNDWGVALLKLGELTGEKKHIIEALEKFEHAIGKWKENQHEEHIDLEWLYNYACALDYLGDFSEDVDCYEKAVQVLTFVIQQDPEYIHARYNLALALSHLGESLDDVESLQKSILLFQELLQENPEDEVAWSDCGMAMLNLAVLIQDAANTDMAQKLFDQAENKFFAALSLGNETSNYNLACLFSLSGNYTASMHYLEKAQLCDALPPIDEVLNDEWLEGVRTMPNFRHFIAQLFGKKPEGSQ